MRLTIAGAAFVRIKNTTPTPEGWHLCRKPFAYIFKLRQERHLYFATKRKTEKPKRPALEATALARRRKHFFPSKNNIISLRWSSIRRDFGGVFTGWPTFEKVGWQTFFFEGK
ncbi:MAG: hypothetical protein D6714_05045, partial [Bacteroidetes bacterium]